MSEFSIGSVSVEQGRRDFGFVNVSKSPSGGSIHIPVGVVNGSEKGPVFCSVAGTHGDEVESIYAVMKMIQRLDPAKLKGTFVGVTALNQIAFENRTRGLDFWGPDPMDMNRIFPANPKKGLLGYIATTYFKEIISRCQYVVGHHGGPRNCFLTQRVIVDRSVPKTIELGKVAGQDWDILQLPQHAGEGTLEDECNRHGIVCLTLEFGGGGNRVPESLEKNSDSIYSAIENMLRHLGMLQGPPKTAQKWYVIERDDPRSMQGGFMVGLPAFKLRNRLTKGTPMAKMLDIHGNEVETITAPSDGFIMGLKTEPVSYPGERIIWFGKHVDTLT